MAGSINTVLQLDDITVLDEVVISQVAGTSGRGIVKCQRQGSSECGE
jgi:hypothetical protein